MAAGGAVAGFDLGRHLVALQAGVAAAPEAWKPLDARGLRLGSDELSSFEGPAMGAVHPTLALHLVTAGASRSGSLPAG